MNLKHILSTEGRLGQRGFLTLGGGLLVSGLVLSILPLIGTLVPLLLAWPWTCIAVKRLHDIGRSGRIIVALMGLNLMFALMAALGSALTAVIGFGALPLLGLISGLGALLGLASFALLIWLACTPSQDGPNHFGPPAPAFSLV